VVREKVRCQKVWSDRQGRGKLSIRERPLDGWTGWVRKVS